MDLLEYAGIYPFAWAGNEGTCSQLFREEVLHAMRGGEGGNQTGWVNCRFATREGRKEVGIEDHDDISVRAASVCSWLLVSVCPEDLGKNGRLVRQVPCLGTIMYAVCGERVW